MLSSVALVLDMLGVEVAAAQHTLLWMVLATLLVGGSQCLSM